MDSSSSRLEVERRKQAEIRKQIALLEAQLVDIPGQDINTYPPASPKRKQSEEALLAPATPSPSEWILMRRNFRARLTRLFIRKEKGGSQQPCQPDQV